MYLKFQRGPVEFAVSNSAREGYTERSPTVHNHPFASPSSLSCSTSERTTPTEDIRADLEYTTLSLYKVPIISVCVVALSLYEKQQTSGLILFSSVLHRNVGILVETYLSLHGVTNGLGEHVAEVPPFHAIITWKARAIINACQLGGSITIVVKGMISLRRTMMLRWHIHDVGRALTKVVLFAAWPRLTQKVILRGIYIPYSKRALQDVVRCLISWQVSWPRAKKAVRHTRYGIFSSYKWVPSKQGLWILGKLPHASVIRHESPCIYCTVAVALWFKTYCGYPTSASLL